MDTTMSLIDLATRPTWTIPMTPPPGFLNLSTSGQHGVYVFGFHDFQVADLHIANIFHRTLTGSSDDFILGIISVLLIAVVSELFHVIVLRSRHGNRVTRDAMHAALLIDEVTHFRNLSNLFRPTSGTNPAHPPNETAQTDSLPHRPGIPVRISLTVFFISVLLLAAEVFAVYLTQPMNVYTASNQYNVRGIMPVGIKFEAAKRIMKKTDAKRCVTPSMMYSNQTRLYSLSACIERSDSKQNQDETSPFSTPTEGETNDLFKPDAFATSFILSSWYHSAGCDHHVRFSNGRSFAWHAIQLRATLLQSNIGQTKIIHFDNIDNDNATHARFIHAYFMTQVLTWSCERTPSDICAEAISQVKMSEVIGRPRNITLWNSSNQSSNADTVQNLVSISTKFDTPPVANPFLAVESALAVFGTSVAIEEVEGPSKYTDMDTGAVENGIPHLAYEEGRVAGATMLVVIFIVLFVILVILRALLKPVSLSDVAHNVIHGGPVRVIVVDANGNELYNHPISDIDSITSSRIGHQKGDKQSANTSCSSVKTSLDSDGRLDIKKNEG